MKKIIALIMIGVLIFTLAACGTVGKTQEQKQKEKQEKIANGETVEASFKILDEKLSTEQYAIGFKKGNTELRDAVQAALYQLFVDGKVDEIAKKYADYNLDTMLCLKAEDATTFDVDAASADFKARKKLTVGFDAEYPPYGYLDGKDYTGFDLELAEEVCKIYGWKLVKLPIDWNAKDAQLDSGVIDLIWNGFTMTGRENDYTWSVPYIDNSIVMVVSADSSIKSLSDLSGKVVATQTGSSAEAALQGDQKDLAATFADLKAVPDYNTAFMDLESGMVEAIAVDIGVAQYQLANR